MARPRLTTSGEPHPMCAAQGARLKLLMQRVGRSVDDVRKYMGVSTSTVYTWLSGQAELSMPVRVRLAGFLMLERVGDLSPTDYDPPKIDPDWEAERNSTEIRNS